MRATQIGLSIADLDLLDVGFVLDMFTEKMNDIEEEQEKSEIANQDYFDNF